MKTLNRYARAVRERIAAVRVPEILACALLPLFAFTAVGCDGLFDVDNPTNIVDEELEDPELADALGNTPEVAVADPYGDAVAWQSAISDEGFLAGSGTFRIQLDEGIISPENNITGGIYDELAAARWIADNTLDRLSELLDDPGSDRRVAHGTFWAAMARLTLADHFEDVVYDGEPPITPAEAIRDAIELFEEASQIAQAAGDPVVAGAAKGAVARAYRSLYFEELHHGAGEDPSLFANAAAAAEEALALDPEFVEFANYSPPGSQNPVFNSLNQSRYLRLDPQYANLQDPVSGERDPRVIHGDLQGPAVRNGDPVYLVEKYPDEDGDIPVSKADEARLVIAEHELLYGDPQDAVDRINEVRADVDLPEFSSSDEDEIYDQLRYERLAEFWYEGRRWQDIRYYEIIPDRWADASKAAGVHRRWPVSVTERDNNPAYN